MFVKTVFIIAPKWESTQMTNYSKCISKSCYTYSHNKCNNEDARTTTTREYADEVHSYNLE